MEIETKFRNANGARLLKALFHEMVFDDKPNAIYTLKDQDHEYEGRLYKSMYQLYMNMGDITEYEFANKYLDGWEHWKMLCACKWFKPYVERWREELDLRLRAQALNAIKQKAVEGGRDSLEAYKYLIEKKYIPKDAKSNVGRPTKEKIKEEAERLFNEQSEVDEHFDRLRTNGAVN